MNSYRSDIVIIGGGAAGLMAAYGAAMQARLGGLPLTVTVLEKMPRPGRKIMITGKGRCNFTNVKPWNDFSTHISSGSRFVKNAFYNFDCNAVLDFFESQGVKTVVERGDRAYPASYKSSDIVDALVRACLGEGVKIATGTEVSGINIDNGFIIDALEAAGPARWKCSRLIISTGGLSYPGTGSTGDGYTWARSFGHTVTPLFPSLTALVPAGYKTDVVPDASMKGHIDRSFPLSETGSKLRGIHLENIAVSVSAAGGGLIAEEFGEADFTDGGIEGAAIFRLSRKCVKAMLNGARLSLKIDLKPAVSSEDLLERVRSLWKEADKPSRRPMREKDKCMMILRNLLPAEMIPAFLDCHPRIMTLQRISKTQTKLWVNLENIVKALKDWEMDIDGYVGYERCVVTAGGVSTDEVSPKTMESKKCPGLYLCGEVLDIDSDTGGYNLQTAFSTGMLAGQSAATSLA